MPGSTAPVLLHVGQLPVDSEMRQRQKRVSSVALPCASWRPMDCCSREVDPALALCFCGTILFVRLEHIRRMLPGAAEHDQEEDRRAQGVSDLRFVPVRQLPLGMCVFSLSLSFFLSGSLDLSLSLLFLPNSLCLSLCVRARAIAPF